MKEIFRLKTLKVMLLIIISLIILLIRPIFFPDIVYAPDSEHYIMLVEFFRGNASLLDVGEAFRTRLLVPLIASFLPWDAFFCLTAVNICFTLLSIFFFNRFLLYFEIDEKKKILGTLIFIFAGPTIIDGATPVTDSAGIFFIILSLFLYSYLKIDTKADLIIGIVIGIGTFAKETVTFIIPVLIIWRLMDFKFYWKIFLRFVILIGFIPLTLLFLLKLAIPTSYFWYIDLSVISKNIPHLFEPLTLATIVQISLLSLVGIFGNYQNLINKSKLIWKLIIGICMFFISIIYIFLSAAMASRFLWPFFIFIIPFFLIGLKEFGELKNLNNSKD